MVEDSDLPMLCLILIVGGLLLMMGQHDRCEALFDYFRLEDQVPETASPARLRLEKSFALHANQQGEPIAHDCASYLIL